MLSSREWATLIIIFAAIVAIFLWPKTRRGVVPHLKPLVTAAFAPRLVAVYLLVLAMCVWSTLIARAVGLWEPALLKDTVITTFTVILPMTFRSMSFKTGGALTHRLIRETLTLAALLTLYLDTAPLALGWEIVVQLVAIFFGALTAVAATKPEWAPVKRLCDVVLALLGTFLIVWTTVRLFQEPPDWAEFFRSLFFGFWLPLSLLPFFYLFGFYARTDSVRARARAFGRPLTPALVAALLVGTRLRLGLLAKFTGRYSDLGRKSGLREGLAYMRSFREDVARREREEQERLRALDEHTGNSGLDDHGAHLDRREFDVTKDRLDWIWTCQNGQFERQGGRYWTDLLDWIVDAEKHGLPQAHGFTVEVTRDGQVFRAWRRTPGGAVLGVGARERGSKFLFQGEEPPTHWPGETEAWVDAVRAEWPPDWHRSDRSRL